MTKKSAQRRRRRRNEKIIEYADIFEMLSVSDSRVVHQELDRLCAEWWHLSITSIVMDYMWVTLRVGTYVQAYVPVYDELYKMNTYEWQLTRIISQKHGGVGICTLGSNPNQKHVLDINQNRGSILTLPDESYRIELEFVGISDYVDVYSNSKWYVGFVVDIHINIGDVRPKYDVLVVRWFDTLNLSYTTVLPTSSPHIARLGTHTFQY